ncbi:MAG: 23S rRNA (adenine(2503)-C(2))-methyltransferase RlmN [Firmicutes bacterium]|nr:23S rRNA (adenine(2503)-C(2))-methyltransferase RlmN [Bacillota bacterium]
MMEKTDIRSLSLEETEKMLIDMGEKKFRAKQIYSWLHKKQTDDFDDMTDISVALREKLKENCEILKLKTVKKLTSSEDETVKYLFKTNDANIIECVLMKYSYGYAACISSQIGCRMGCTFCASTIDGLERNLTAGEMAGEVYKIQNDCKNRIGNIVIMGSGEPLDNYDNIIKFLKIINSKEGNALGARHITVSTCGLAEKIYDMAELELQITLAISLHAPNDEIRKKLMPIANKYSIDEVIKAASYYAENTKRRVTYEYALIDGINDSKKAARELADRLKGSLCHVNLIPINDVSESGYKKSSEKTIAEFKDTLTEKNIQTTIRRELGSDINAACGQLRKSYADKKHDIYSEV